MTRLLLTLLLATTALAERPNVVWIVTEDMSPHFGCCGEKSIQTPHVDQLAAEGTRFAKAFVTAPICSISRSAMITGMYQTSIDAQHHRSGRGSVKIHLPADITPVPTLLKQAGYHVSNGSWGAKAAKQKGKAKAGAIGKTDYNFEHGPDLYDAADWSARKPGQPFFAQIQLIGGKLRDNAEQCRNRVKQTLGSLTPSAGLPLPPYYPSTPGILEDWANTLDACRFTDHEVGQIVQRLKDEGVLDNTLIIFITDHGVSHARGKQFLYDEGTHIPFIVRGPGVPKQVRTDIIEHIDMAAISLAAAGIPIPANMQAKNSLAADYQPRSHTFAARDRADETVDHIRSVRTDRFKYIRNFLPQRPHLQPNNYKDNKPCLIALRQARDDGKLDPVQQQLFAPTRAPEELYDLTTDPWEIKNLATDPAHADILKQLRTELETWITRTHDHGAQPEPPERYDSDMKAYVGEKPTGRNEEVHRNIALMKQWAAEGK